MSVVKAKEILSIKDFFKRYFGFCPITTGEEDELRKLLDENGLEFLSIYPLDEIEEIIEKNIPVVLVDTSFINKCGEICREHRWVELPYAFSPQWNVEKHFINGRIDVIRCENYREALIQVTKIENEPINRFFHENFFLRISKEKNNNKED